MKDRRLPVSMLGAFFAHVCEHVRCKIIFGRKRFFRPGKSHSNIKSHSKICKFTTTCNEEYYCCTSKW